jgi:ribosomal protein S6--L-glutamate ligase
MKNDYETDRVALGRQLSGCGEVRTLGIKCNWQDYSADEQRCIRMASTVYFPTILYAASLHGAGKRIFPSITCYTHLGDKTRQTALFAIGRVPMPETRIFRGGNLEEKITDAFSFPFVAKVPCGTGRGQGVFLVRDRAGLKKYLQITSTAYIQEYLGARRDLRVVVIGRKPVLAYWKEARGGDFRNNVARGAGISFDNVPEEGIALALETALNCGIDHAGFDVAESEEGFVVIEANMKFGTEGFERAGISYRDILCEMVRNNEI